MKRKRQEQPDLRNYRPPNRVPEREQQWKTIAKAMEPPAQSRPLANVIGRRRNPR